MGALNFVCLFFIHILKLFVTCRLCVIYVREDNDSNIYIGNDYTVCMDYMDLAVHCPRKAVKLNHALGNLDMIYEN